MNILVIGSGGREHALCWKIAQSPLLGRLFCAPGNPGIARHATLVALNTSDQDAVVAFCRAQSIELVVIGPEQPLVEGLVDRLSAEGIRAFGPSAKAAQLEGSKAFTKALCAANAIPTADFHNFNDAASAKAWVADKRLPIVIKADGLAAGKGVVIAQNLQEANDAIDEMFSGRFGAAGTHIVVEEFLEGEEASFFVLCDGEHAMAMASAQDHKRVGDGDTGPNTGGMGAYSPAPVLTRALEARVMAEIIQPTVAAMKAMGAPYKGVLYAGLMLTNEGPKLIEYNARFGDPECQVLMMRLKSDIVPALIAVADGHLANHDLQWLDKPAVTVVMAAEGYPGTPRKGTVISGLEDAEHSAGAHIFHAGTAENDQGQLVANGGRVLNVTALGESVKQAAGKAYAAIDLIQWTGGFCRRDIGWRAISREG